MHLVRAIKFHFNGFQLNRKLLYLLLLSLPPQLLDPHPSIPVLLASPHQLLSFLPLNFHLLAHREVHSLILHLNLPQQRLLILSRQVLETLLDQLRAFIMLIAQVLGLVTNHILVSLLSLFNLLLSFLEFSLSL
jgi:hypothetical protein